MKRRRHAVVGRPQLLIFDGLFHDMQPSVRDTIIQRLCSKDEPWTVIFISNDPNLTPYVDRCLSLGEMPGPGLLMS